MKIDLVGKNAIIGGASQGIGFAIARQFAACGANLILISRSEEKLKNAIKQLPENGSQIFKYLVADFSNPHSFADDLQNLIAEFGSIHILVNNSGGPSSGSASNASLEDYLSAFNSHLLSFQMLVKLVLDGMKKQQFGRIINITSVGAKQPIDNLGVSNTIRGAVSSWAKILSRELAPFGITVNNILPGYIATERLTYLFQSIADKNQTTLDFEFHKLANEIPAGRIGKPEEIGYVAAFLASNYANYINGINFPVDGGYLRTL